ncbi:MAG: DUF3618 domain-containing protein [Solirubrobacterales bacterium]|nr:DUF3618 domain-containing protein [Solirubrobacterales bacterium]MBV8940604.1 DUF3618 domain-containing protein [Solirubrobacterales bacterium]MBV9166031.1 DUF3618 domain-containing protein [Solirubrobacterales bacterium]MBV9534658.1 DUF3618 domain-containing protein [Solirubrobacterales bacterium]
MSTSDKAPEAVGEQQGKSPEELRRDIDQTREQLGDTVQALAEKTDVRAQAKRRIDALKGTVRQKQEDAKARAKSATPESANAGAQQVLGAARQNPLQVATAGAFAAGFLIGRWSK